MPTPVFKMDTREFDRTLNEYRKFSKRDETEIVNTKAFFIARRAVVETGKADAGKIRRFFDRATQRIVGKIINARRGKRGEKGLYGDAMAEAQATMKAARLRSIAFIKSGWLPAIKTLEKYVKYKRGAARSEAGSSTGRAHIVGQSKGSAQPARQTMFGAEAIIKNLAVARHSETKDPLGEFGSPALQKAIDSETASMRDYILKKMTETAKKAGIKSH